MSGAPSTATTSPEWFLARDGEQFGPLSDAELRKLVEMGHLKPTDLLWREGFPEWRSARILLNDRPAPAPAPAPAAVPPAEPAAVVAQQPQSAAQRSVAPAASAQSDGAHRHPVVQADRAAHVDVAVAPRTVPLHAERGPSVQAPAPAHSQHRAAPQPHVATTMPAAAAAPYPHAYNPYAAPGQYIDPQHLPAAAPQPSPRVAPHSGQAEPIDLVRPAAAAPVAAQQRRASAAPVHRPRDDFDDEDDADDFDDTGSSVGRWFKRIAVLLFFTVTLAAAGWYAYPYRDRIAATLKLSSLNSLVTGGSVSPLTGFKATAEATDASLQKNNLWRVLKRDFPEWYAERTKEAAALIASGKSEAEIGQQMLQSMVALRRKHAGDALSATMPRLKALATAFADNLVALRRVSVAACHTFVANGEMASEYVRLLSDNAQAGPLQAQLVAVFEAIADGRKVPRIYPQPKQTDYNLLVSVLETRGWTDADMQLFSDSRRFGAAPPEKVCQMVTDWFKAQVELTDADVQLRLLADALKPVVAG